jgi:hypothetical protein
VCVCVSFPHRNAFSEPFLNFSLSFSFFSPQESEEERATASLALCTVLELLRVAAVALSPVTPALSKRVYVQLGFSEHEFQVWKRVWSGPHALATRVVQAGVGAGARM